MFYKCISLISLPDISVWNTSDVDSIKGLFGGCCSLLLLPDTSKWDTSKISHIDEIYEEILYNRFLDSID